MTKDFTTDSAINNVNKTSIPAAGAAGAPKKVRTLFAPSPTGYLHFGGLRTAL